MVCDKLAPSRFLVMAKRSPPTSPPSSAGRAGASQPPPVSSGDDAHARSNGQAETRPEGDHEAPPAVWADIDSLHLWKDNPRKNDGEPVDVVARSIKRFGFAAPIIARTNGEIIGGHTRWKAAKKLGLSRVPVRYMALDPVEAHLLAIADNKTNELAEWDDKMLGAVLGTMGEDVDKLTGTGMSEEELEKLLNPDDTGGDEEGGSKLNSGLSYAVIIECTDERQQATLLERFERDGLKCRPVIS
jgi:ParB-like nuclease domain